MAMAPPKAQTKSNIDADLLAPAGRQFRQPYFPPDTHPTTRVGGGGHGLSVEALFTTNAQE